MLERWQAVGEQGSTPRLVMLETWPRDSRVDTLPKKLF